MGMRVAWVGYGRPALRALAAEVAAAKAADPLAPVTVVVPSNHLGVATRRRLAGGALGRLSGRGSGLVAATFVTPYRLGELLGAATLAGQGRRPISTPVLAAALRRALARAPGMFAEVADHPSTEAALVAAHRELRDLPAASLDALAATGPRAADVVRLHRAARRALEAAWYDEEDLLAAAAAQASSPAAAALGTLVVHLPQRLGHHAAALLGALAAEREVAVLAGRTGHPDADAEVLDAVTRLAGPRAAGAGPPTGACPHAPVDVGRTRVLTASDADDEVRAAVRLVVDAARAGTRLDGIAILHASPEPYGRLVHEHLAAAGIPASGAAVAPLGQRVAGRTLLHLLALPGVDHRRRDVLAWLASAPLTVGGREVPVPTWERLSREAAVVGGRAQWDRLLEGLADRLEAVAERLADDPDPEAGARAARARADAAEARALRCFVLELVDELSRVSEAPRSWGYHAAWARQLLDRLLGGPDQREAWPAEERSAAERVERAVARLAALDAVEGPVPLDVFARTLQLELDADLGRTGRLGEGVLVGSVGMGVGLELDLVVVLGLAEGSFPRPRADDSLLPDSERAAAGGGLVRRHQHVDRQHRQLLACLAGARRQVLCLPRGDLRRSTERAPSRWVLDLASGLAGRRLRSADLLGTRADWLVHVASFDDGLRRLSVPATEQEHRLRSLLARPPTAACGAGGLAHGDADTDPVLQRAGGVLAARRSGRFTRFDGNLAGLAVPSPTRGTTSATRLERWAVCPFASLVGDVLGVQPVEDPEDQLRITPLDRGDLVHRALELFLLEVLDRPPEARPGPDDRWTDADRARLRCLAEGLCDDVARRARTGRPIFWRRDRARILADLDHVLSEDDSRRAASRTRPLAAELAFGTRAGVAGVGAGGPATLGPVALPLVDGRLVHVIGKADRVDLADDGTIHVTDYKSGRSDRYHGLGEEQPDQQGRRLQLVVYGEAARALVGSPGAEVRADYWFVSSAGRFRSIGYPVTPDVMARTSRTLTTIVDGMEAGVFPARPTAGATSPWVECPSCDPDGLGVSELRRAWERKRHDPALAPYAALAEADGTATDHGAGAGTGAGRGGGGD